MIIQPSFYISHQPWSAHYSIYDLTTLLFMLHIKRTAFILVLMCLSSRTWFLTRTPFLGKYLLSPPLTFLPSLSLPSREGSLHSSGSGPAYTWRVYRSACRRPDARHVPEPCSAGSEGSSRRGRQSCQSTCPPGALKHPANLLTIFEKYTFRSFIIHSL